MVFLAAARLPEWARVPARRWDAAGAELLAVLSGSLLVFSFPKFGHGSVAWVALAPMLVALRGRSGLHAFRIGYVTGAVASLGLLYWTALVVIQFGGLSLPVGIGVMILLCLAVALFPGLFAWLVARWIRAFGPPALLLSPVAWVATEILRVHTLFSFPWCLLGYSQHDHLPFVQIAAYTAVYGVSFLVACSSSALAYAVAEPDRGRRRSVLVAVAAVLLSVWIHGAWTLSRPLSGSSRMRVGLVQAGIPQGAKWDPAKAWDNVEHHVSLTRRAAAEGARFVVWPESAVPFLYDWEPVLAQQLQGLVRETGVHLLFGSDDVDALDDTERRVWVGAKMLTPAGELPFRYHKIRLVPFGEYVPMEPLLSALGVEKLVQEVGAFTPGREARVGAVGDLRFGAFICYEAIFPDLVRRFTAGGAHLLVNMTNDAWYGRTSAPYQHFAMARFRSVENGKWLLRAANTGITAAVDPRGRVVGRTQLFERTVLVQDVAAEPGSTFYARHGDVFAWGCFGLTLVLTARTFRR